DATTVYLAHGGRLTALSLEDGKRLWDRPLADAPARNWQTMRIGEYLLAYPIPRAGVPFPVPLTFGMLECGPLPLEGHTGAGFPVLICDPRTGNLVQRLNFPVDVPRVGVRWVSAPRPAPMRPAVAISSQGLVALLGRSAWGLAGYADEMA